MAKHGDVERGEGWELRCGPWQEVLKGVECNALITDPPYSEKTHGGQSNVRRGIGYAPIGQVSADMCAAMGGMCSGWALVFCDHELFPEWAAGFRQASRYVFAPVPLVETGSTVRLTGDGPASWTTWVMASRPRTKGFASWGALPGAYVQSRERKPHMGGKPLQSMRAIVRDYSRPNNLICDPYAGGGTTLLAAVMEGRRAIGAELDPETFEKAVARLRKGYTPCMFAQGAAIDALGQELPW